MLDHSKLSECISVFKDSICSTYDKSSRCRKCASLNTFPVYYKDLSTGRYHLKCVKELTSDWFEGPGVFGIVDSLENSQRSISVYEDECTARGKYYVSMNIAGLSGFRLIDDKSNK